MMFTRSKHIHQEFIACKDAILNVLAILLAESSLLLLAILSGIAW